MGGGKEARQGLRHLMQATRGGRVSWGRTQGAYRQHLYVQGRQKGADPQGRPIRQGFFPEEVKKVLAAGGRLPMHELLRCRARRGVASERSRVRYFSDGLALGGQAFLEQIFQRYRDHFGPTRQSGARAMRYGAWGALCTLRSLHLQPVTRG